MSVLMYCLQRGSDDICNGQIRTCNCCFFGVMLILILVATVAGRYLRPARNCFLYHSFCIVIGSIVLCVHWNGLSTTSITIVIEIS